MFTGISVSSSLGLTKPHGIDSHGIHAKFVDIVNISYRYICSGSPSNSTPQTYPASVNGSPVMCSYSSSTYPNTARADTIMNSYKNYIKRCPEVSGFNWWYSTSTETNSQIPSVMQSYSASYISCLSRTGNDVAQCMRDVGYQICNAGDRYEINTTYCTDL